MTQRTENANHNPPDRERLWAIYLKKNPHWAEEGARLTPQGLQKFVEQVWQHGYNHAIATTTVKME